jgi:pilus assembly protein CpaB
LITTFSECRLIGIPSWGFWSLAMNIRTIATLAVAILLGLIAVVLVRGYIGGAKGGAGPQASSGQIGPGTPVVIAAAPIARGAPLDPKLLKVVTYPADSVPAGAFHSIPEVAQTGPNARLALRSFTPGEPLLTPNVSGPGGKLTLSSAMTAGMRAVALRSSDVAGVGGFILPGDRVDILLTRSIGGGDANNTVTQVLAENILVLGVDQSNNDETDKPVVARTLTVEVTPDQAQTISLAQSVGNVSLTLRQVADAAGLARKSTTVADLGFVARKAPAAPTGPSAPGPAAGPARPRLLPGQVEVHVTRGVETSGYPVARY